MKLRGWPEQHSPGWPAGLHQTIIVQQCYARPADNGRQLIHIAETASRRLGPDKREGVNINRNMWQRLRNRPLSSHRTPQGIQNYFWDGTELWVRNQQSERASYYAESEYLHQRSSTRKYDPYNSLIRAAELAVPTITSEPIIAKQPLKFIFPN